MRERVADAKKVTCDLCENESVMSTDPTLNDWQLNVAVENRLLDVGPKCQKKTTLADLVATSRKRNAEEHARRSREVKEAAAAREAELERQRASDKEEHRKELEAEAAQKELEKRRQAVTWEKAPKAPKAPEPEPEPE